jgi:uncharacterized membrane protein
MKNRSSNNLLQTIGFGVIAGMRSMSAPALISHYLSNRFTYKLNRSPLRFIKAPLVSTGLKVLAASEMLGDKVPAMPDRISPGILASRGLSGALVGAVIHKTNGDKILKGALIGGAVAIAATFASFYLRKKITHKTNVSDPIVGLIEDALTLTGGIGLLRSR